MITRRNVLEGLLATGLFGGCRTSLKDSAAYTATILGDLHYDTAPAEVYHAQFIKDIQGTGLHQMRFKEFTRNATMWANLSPKIMAASGKCAVDDSAFVLQMGDLIQGDCNDFDVHYRMLVETANKIKSYYPAALPFVTTCGNHDIREGGKGRNMTAAPTYARFATDFHLKELSSRLVSDITGSTFAFRQGPDLFLVLDFNFAERQLELVERLLEENRDVRYTFIVTHGGVFPFDCWPCRWFYLGGVHASNAGAPFDPATDGMRRRMRSLFARRNAIVLCGHTHHLELKEARFPEGIITEMTMNSVPCKSGGGEFPGEPLVKREGVENYGKVEWVEKNPSIKALFAEYQPYMTRFYFADAVGHAKLRVSDEGVWFDFYGMDSLSPTKTFRLR